MFEKKCEHCGASEIEQALDYNKETGVFVWRKPRKHKSQFKGKAAGTLCKGYIQISFRNKSYKAHRLAYFFIHHEWPEMIDHIDGNKANNRIENLRSSNALHNQQNRKRHRQGRHVGVSFRKDNKKWVAQFWHKKNKIYVGQFETEQEAIEAYKESKQKYRDWQRRHFD